jgi:hypothetical protein
MTQAQLRRARLRLRRIQWDREDRVKGWGRYSRWHQPQSTRQAKAHFDGVMLAALLCIAVCLELGVAGLRMP